MEKPWLDNLVDALQTAPPKERMAEQRVSVAEEAVAVEPVAEETAFERPIGRRGMSARSSDRFAGVFDSQAPRTRPPLEYAGKTPWNESWSDRVLAHAPAITIALLFVAALVVLAFFSRVQIGQTVVRLGERISGEPAQQSASPDPNANASAASTGQPAPPPAMTSGSPQEPVSSPNPSAANGNAATSPAAGAPKNSDASPSGASPNVSSSDRASAGSRDNSGQPPAAERAIPRTSPTSPTSTSIDNGDAELSLAHASLSRARTPEAKARAAELLWAAVEKGSSNAEIELADAYGRGSGVRKNCQQARILLAAARDKHNPFAEKESAELREYGCR